MLVGVVVFVEREWLAGREWRYEWYWVDYGGVVRGIVWLRGGRSDVFYRRRLDLSVLGHGGGWLGGRGLKLTVRYK